MGISKDRISPPLEAGTSLLSARNLPPQLTAALDYVSDRLARKRLHLTLIVVRRDTSLSSPSPSRTSFSSPSPTTSLFGSFMPSPGLSHRNSHSSQSSTSSLSRTQHPSLPSSPKDTANAPSPKFPTSQSSSGSRPTLNLASNPYNLTLIHASTLTARAESHLRRAISKASTVFGIGGGWLTSQSMTTTITCPATNDLIRRSLIQNEVVFSGEGITLLSLDHVYTFKAALMSYSADVRDSVKLSEAVDALRRLNLTSSGRHITKCYLLRSYGHIPVSLSALFDVNELYKVSYGGKERVSGVVVEENEARASPPPLKTTFGVVENRGPHFRGVKTPNGFEDITPVTRGEWCFLMVGEGWKGRAAEVQTC